MRSRARGPQQGCLGPHARKHLRRSTNGPPACDTTACFDMFFGNGPDRMGRDVTGACISTTAVSRAGIRTLEHLQGGDVYPIAPRSAHGASAVWSEPSRGRRHAAARLTSRTPCAPLPPRPRAHLCSTLRRCGLLRHRCVGRRRMRCRSAAHTRRVHRELHRKAPLFFCGAFRSHAHRPIARADGRGRSAANACCSNSSAPSRRSHGRESPSHEEGAARSRGRGGHRRAHPREEWQRVGERCAAHAVEHYLLPRRAQLATETNGTRQPHASVTKRRAAPTCRPRPQAAARARLRAVARA